MKKFLKFLGVCLLIFVGWTAYFIWSLQSLRLIIWYCVAVFTGAGIWSYMKETIYVTTLQGNITHHRPMTKLEKLAEIIRVAIGSAIIGSVVWCIGYGFACTLGWTSDYWEGYLIIGALIVVLVCTVIWCFVGLHNRLKKRKAAS